MRETLSMASQISYKILLPGFASVMLLACMADSARADSITLQDGTVVEGKILQANEREVIIETQFSDTITEARRYPRSQVREIQKEVADNTPYGSLAAFPLPDSAFVPSDYDGYLQKREEFIQNYGYSPKVSEVRAEIRAARKEQERVAAGGIKLGGRWLSDEEIRAESVEIEAHKLLAEMKQSQRRGDLVRLLNLSNRLEKEYPGSSVLPEAVESSLESIKSLNRILDHEERNFAITEEKRERGIVLSSPAEQQQMRAARETEIAKFQTRAAAALAGGDKFPPYFVAASDSIKKLRDALVTEQTRLRALPLEKMKESNEVVRKARTSLAQGHVTASEAEVARALELWPANQSALRLKEQVSGEKERRETASAAQSSSLGQADSNP